MSVFTMLITICALLASGPSRAALENQQAPPASSLETGTILSGSAESPEEKEVNCDPLVATSDEPWKLVSELINDVPNRPVEMGGEPDLDACYGWGRTNRDTVLSWYDNGQLMELDLPAGTEVFFCDYEQMPCQNYEGVLIPRPGYHNGGGKGFDGPGLKESTCGASSPQKDRMPVQGPCPNGWIKKEHVDLLAG